MKNNFAYIKNCCTFAVRYLHTCAVKSVQYLQKKYVTGVAFLNSICSAGSECRNLEKATPYSFKNTDNLNFY